MKKLIPLFLILTLLAGCKTREPIEATTETPLEAVMSDTYKKGTLTLTYIEAENGMCYIKLTDTTFDKTCYLELNPGNTYLSDNGLDCLEGLALLSFCERQTDSISHAVYAGYTERFVDKPLKEYTEDDFSAYFARCKDYDTTTFSYKESDGICYSTLICSSKHDNDAYMLIDFGEDNLLIMLGCYDDTFNQTSPIDEVIGSIKLVTDEYIISFIDSK